MEAAKEHLYIAAALMTLAVRATAVMKTKCVVTEIVVVQTYPAAK